MAYRSTVNQVRLGLVLASGWCACAGAQVSAELLAALDAPVWAQRDEAMRRMLEDRTAKLEDLEQLSRSGELSPEQEIRVRQVARRSFEMRRLAGLGVQFSGFGPQGVVIGQTIEGFDAANHLVPGDMVQAANGQTMHTQDELRWTILSLDPGQEIEMRVLRGGSVVTLRVLLGAFADLPDAQRPSQTDLAYAFYKRWQRRALPPPRMPVGAEISIEDWARVEAAGVGEDRWPMTRENASRMVGLGGQPRSSTILRVGGHDMGQAGFFERDPERTRITEVAAIVDRTRALMLQRTLLEERAVNFERHADLAGDPERKQQLIELRNQTLAEVIRVDTELAQLRVVLQQLREGMP